MTGRELLVFVLGLVLVVCVSNTSAEEPTHASHPNAAQFSHECIHNTMPTESVLSSQSYAVDTLSMNVTAR